MLKMSLLNKLIYVSQILSFIIIILFFLTYEYNLKVRIVFLICIFLNLISAIVLLNSKFKILKYRYINIICFITSLLFSILMLGIIIILYMVSDISN